MCVVVLEVKFSGWLYKDSAVTGSAFGVGLYGPHVN